MWGCAVIATGLLVLVEGCGIESSHGGSQLIEVWPADLASGVSVSPQLTATFRFDRPMLKGAAILRSKSLAEHMEMRWDPSRATGSVHLGPWVEPGTEYELELFGLVDEYDRTPDLGPLAIDGRLRFATESHAASQAPVAVLAQPSPDASGIYPAQVDGGTAPHVAIRVTFNEEMDPSWNTLMWRPAESSAWNSILGDYEESRRTFRATIASPPLSGRPPLANNTLHEIELIGLRSRLGYAPSEIGPIPRRLRFTTGQFDSLLNHSCGHVTLGPFADVVAAPDRGPAIPTTDAAHTRYTVTLPSGYNAWFTRFRPTTSARVHLFVDTHADLGVEREDQTALAVVREPTPAACCGISTRQSFTVSATDRVWLRFPAVGSEVKLIVELEAK